MKRFFIFLFAVTACLHPVHAQTSSKLFVLGATDEIQSKELGEQRTLNIYLPDGYDDSPNKYPVIYLLDGSANEDFVHICGVVQFLTMIEAMPPSIVVGIANVDRRRDFTFPSGIAADKKLVPTGGGSERFMRFVEKELLPYIRDKYSASANTTLIGQSLGGLVATQLLLEHPGLFANYIIISPSLWWDKESLLGKAPALIQHFPKKNIHVFVGVGTEGKQMEGDARKLAELLRAPSANLKTTFSFMPQENHLTILHNSAYKALEWLNSTKAKDPDKR